MEPETALLEPQVISSSQPKPLMWIAIVVLAALLSSGATYAVVKSQTQTAPASEPTLPAQQVAQPTPEVVQSPTSDLTANWKMYTNIKNGYSLKYPVDRFVRLICSEGGEQDYFYLETKETATQDRDVINMSTCNRDAYYSLEITHPESFIEPKTDEYAIVTSGEIVVGGVKGKRFIATKTDVPSPVPEWHTEIHISHNNKNYQIIFGARALEETFNQIISTFKFTP